MSDKEFGSEIWVVLSLYFVILIGILVYATWQRHSAAGFSGENEKGDLVDHYLAGRQLGPIVLGFSLFASMFSGYTVVGLPAEAYDNGFSAWRWVGSSTFVTIVYMSYAPRLQFLARIRGHDSLLSYIKDRYGITCQRTDPMHWLLVVVILAPCFIYLCAQFDAFANTINSISNESISPLAAAILLAVLLTIYESMGGLTAVALTDVIQGGTLLLGAMAITVFMDTHFEGLPAITKALESESPEHVNVMDATKGLSWAEFWIGVGLQRALYPDYPQRAMAARSQDTLRIGTVILAISPFLIQVPLLFYGIIGRVHHPDLDNSKQVFSKVVLDIIHYNTFGKIAGSVMMSATLAGIMSTADSSLIVVSQIVTLDIIRPLQDWLSATRRPPQEREPETETVAKSQQKLTNASRIVTFISAFICIPIVLSDFNLSFLIQFQSSILSQLAPTVVLGLYWKGMHRYPAMAGILVGVPLGIGLVGNKVSGGILIALGANFIVTFVTALATVPQSTGSKHDGILGLVSWEPPSSEQAVAAMLSGTSEADDTQGINDKAKQTLAEKCSSTTSSFMPCYKEPVSWRWWVFVSSPVLAWFALPFYREAGHVDPYLSGSPAWAVFSLIVLFIVHCILIYCVVYHWEGAKIESQAPSEDAGNALARLETGELYKADLSALQTELSKLLKSVQPKDADNHTVTEATTQPQGQADDIGTQLRYLRGQVQQVATVLEKGMEGNRRWQI